MAALLVEDLLTRMNTLARSAQIFVEKNASSKLTTLIIFQLSLQYFDSHSCGASVISENFALTASHCVEGWVHLHLKSDLNLASNLNTEAPDLSSRSKTWLQFSCILLFQPFCRGHERQVWQRGRERRRAPQGHQNRHARRLQLIRLLEQWYRSFGGTIKSELNLSSCNHCNQRPKRLLLISVFHQGVASFLLWK